MSVFGEQLKKRSNSNKRAVKESEQIIGGVISGRKKFYNYAYLSSENDLRQI